MFDRPRRGVTYFGSWAEDTAPMYGARDAFRVLEAAVERCADENMRTDATTLVALEYLSHYTVKKPAWVDFRTALGHTDPLTRHRVVQSRLEAIRRQLPAELVAILAGLDR